MAQNVTVAGASFSDVPSVVLPKTGGGSASFLDTTIASNAASASDITSGKFAFVNGELVTGTASGGGGGLEYETGTWTPASDIASYTIQFANTHTTAPFYYLISDQSGTYLNTTYTNYGVVYSNWGIVFGNPYYNSSSSKSYGEVRYAYRATNTSNLSFGSATITSSTDTTWSKNASIRAYSGSSSRYWRAGRTYKWIAVWAPTS